MTPSRRETPTIPIIAGPTAGGKTSLALALKEQFPKLEVVSADSRQVYRRLDIGTAKPDPAEREALPHHLIDVVDPTDVYSAGAFRDDAEQAIRECLERGVQPVVVGGTGFYLRSLTEGLSPIPQVPPETHAALESRLEQEGLPALYSELERIDPKAASGIDRADPQRTLRALAVWETTGTPLSEWWKEPPQPPAFSYRWLGVSWQREELRDRISQRTAEMLRAGLREEVAALRDAGIEWDMNSMRTVGYREWRPHFEGNATEGQVADRITIHTAQYAKRQMTWFSAVEEIEWLDARSGGLIEDAAGWMENVRTGAR